MAPQGRIVGGLEDLAGKMRSPGKPMQAPRARGRRRMRAIGRAWHGSFTTAEASSAPGARGGLNREIIKGLSPALMVWASLRRQQGREHDAVAKSAEWRLFSFNWVPIGLMAVALVLGLAFTEFRQTGEHTLGLCVAALYASLPITTRTRRTNAIRSSLRAWVAPAIRAHHPVDDAFDLYFRGRRPADARRQPGAIGPGARARLARLLQLHLRASQTGLDLVVLGYNIIGLPIFGIPVGAGLTHAHRRLHQFIVAFTLALIATTIISVLVPAIRTYDILGIVPDPLRLQARRAISWTCRDLPLGGWLAARARYAQVGGIITFPSFHAAAAVLYLWALWSVWWMRPLR